MRALDRARGNGNSIGGPHLRHRCRPASTTAARIASARQISLPADLNLKDAALKVGYRTGEQFDKWVRPEDMTYPLTNNAREPRPLAVGAQTGLAVVLSV
jgi:hypothetical protein